MAERALAKLVVVVPGASHVVMVSHPWAVAGVIEEAAAVGLNRSVEHCRVDVSTSQVVDSLRVVSIMPPTR
jgi:hypothetical protein